jgi:type IV pilus assembly protein PilM
MAKTFLGIDLGSDTLTLALCKNGDVKKVATVPVPQGLMREGRMTSVQSVGELLRDSMKEHKIRASEAAFVIPNELCFLRNITIPRMSAEQVKINIPYEFTDYLSEEPKNYLFDYAMLDQKEDAAEAGTMELLGVAVHSSIVEEARNAVEKAGMKLAKAAPTECAYISLIRAARHRGLGADEMCIVDVGYRAVRMFMFKGERHMVTRVLEFGMKNIDDVVAEQMGVDVHLAHNYILTNYDDCHHKDYCVNAYNNIAVELSRALNFYRFSNPDTTLADVWLCGGGSAVEPLRDAIKNELDSMTVHEPGELVRGVKGVENWQDYLAAIGITID